MKPTREQIELAAAAIANERGGRRGMPQIANVLDLLPDNLRDDVTQDAQAALEAVGFTLEREANLLLDGWNELMGDTHDAIAEESPHFAAAILRIQEMLGRQSRKVV